jgi:hypothetical protein
MNWKLSGAALGLAFASFAPCLSAAPTDRPGALTEPELYYLDHFDVSRPLREIPVIPPDAEDLIRRQASPVKLISPVQQVPKGWVDPLESQRADAPAPEVGTTLGINVFGVGKGLGTYSPSVAPPDTTGDVGATQYVQWVNLSFAVFNKSTGALTYGPALGRTLWSGFGGPCETLNSGDPLVMYDQFSARWVMTQFAINQAANQFYQCVAVSTTSDATGSYRRWAYSFTGFNDYPKGGVWRDGYYLSFNMFNAAGTAFTGARVCVLDRNQMVTASGTPGPMICFQLSSSYGGLLPADNDGATLAPTGTPGIFLNFGTNSLRLWKFTTNWTTPSSSTLAGPTTISVASFSTACGGGTCIPQGGTTQRLDSLADRLMYRLAYRNFGTYQAMVVNHSVTTSTASSGVRWYEIRNPAGTPSIFQSGTFSPDSTSRWMGSIAQDKQGNMLMGYSASSSTLKPGIRYTGRLVSAAAGSMQTENTLLTGAGSQTGGLSRWGDYSTMSIDPSNDCTLYFTTEYLTANGSFNWSTRIMSAKFPGCI